MKRPCDPIQVIAITVRLCQTGIAVKKRRGDG